MSKGLEKTAAGSELVDGLAVAAGSARPTRGHAFVGRALPAGYPESPQAKFSVTEFLRPMTTKPNALAWLSLSAIVIALDQLSKWWALHALQPAGMPHPVIPGFLNWTLAFNRGAAFSFLASGDGWQRWFFVALAVVISAVLVIWLARTARRDWRTALPLALIVGGAIGNLIDRLHAAQVTDFIQVYYRQWSYPVFNVADCGITVGAVLLIAFGMFSGKPADRVR